MALLTAFNEINEASSRGWPGSDFSQKCCVLRAFGTQSHGLLGIQGAGDKHSNAVIRHGSRDGGLISRFASVDLSLK